MFGIACSEPGVGLSCILNFKAGTACHVERNTPVASHKSSFSNSYAGCSWLLGLSPMDGKRGDLRLYDVGLDWLQGLLLSHGAVAQALWS